MQVEHTHVINCTVALHVHNHILIFCAKLATYSASVVKSNFGSFLGEGGTPLIRGINLHDLYIARASSGDLLIQRTCRRIAAPRTWNRLPTDLRLLRSTDSFRRKLKTFLFDSVFGHQGTRWPVLWCALGLPVRAGSGSVGRGSNWSTDLDGTRGSWLSTHVTNRPKSH